MYWGCISYYGVGILFPVEGNMNTEKYISVLDDNIWLVIAGHFSNHVSARARNLKTISTLFHGQQSPDLHIKENVRKMLKLSVKRRKKKRRKIGAYIDATKDEFFRPNPIFSIPFKLQSKVVDPVNSTIASHQSIRMQETGIQMNQINLILYLI